MTTEVEKPHKPRRRRDGQPTRQEKRAEHSDVWLANQQAAAVTAEEEAAVEWRRLRAQLKRLVPDAGRREQVWRRIGQTLRGVHDSL